jgi:hypothetical protein
VNDGKNMNANAFPAKAAVREQGGPGKPLLSMVFADPTRHGSALMETGRRLP